MNRKTTNRPFAADYTYTVEGNIITIIDLDLGNRSVTNDIDYVLAEIRAEVGDLSGYSVIYRDSMGGGTVFEWSIILFIFTASVRLKSRTR